MPNSVPVNRYAIFVLLASVGCGLDLLTKHWAFNALGPPGGPTTWLWAEYIGLQTSLNEGALFGIGHGRVAIFATLSIVAALAIPYWLFIARAALDRWLTCALGLIMAGILGNLYDRLGLWWTPAYTGYPQHAVRDWILLKYGDWHWPNFNLADSYLVVGALAIFIQAFWMDDQNFIDKRPK